MWKAIGKFNLLNLGLLPDIVSSKDPRSVKEQIEDKYRHGGGWRPINNFTMRGQILYYPGDPPFKPNAYIQIRDELVIFYQMGSLLAVIQKDSSFEVTRVD
jgi:hypothetical protein